MHSITSNGDLMTEFPLRHLSEFRRGLQKH